MKFTARFSFTIPSLAAKKARMCDTKCFSPGLRFSQCFRSSERSISSAVQKLASHFLYISQISGYLIGRITKRSLFSLSSNSVSSFCIALFNYYLFQTPQPERFTYDTLADNNGVEFAVYKMQLS